MLRLPANVTPNASVDGEKQKHFAHVIYNAKSCFSSLVCARQKCFCNCVAFMLGFNSRSFGVDWQRFLRRRLVERNNLSFLNCFKKSQKQCGYHSIWCCSRAKRYTHFDVLFRLITLVSPGNLKNVKNAMSSFSGAKFRSFLRHDKSAEGSSDESVRVVPALQLFSNLLQVTPGVDKRTSERYCSFLDKHLKLLQLILSRVGSK